MFPQEIIAHKRDKKTLSKEEIDFFIKGVADGKISDCQIGAFTMAVFLNSLSTEELINLTLAMRDSGDVLHWKLDAPIIDKHSTGGVGDKISLMLAPILAACGAYVPMIAGRGLGHTGGTLDKLDSIEGYHTIVDTEKFQSTVKNIGCAIVGQSAQLAPADRKIYAVRDVSGTVESIDLITASILSKKLAAGLQYLVMDLKCGNGAFMSNYEDAKKLAQTIVAVANGAGTKTSALITDMNSVLGTTVGNALEVVEAMEYLQNKKRDARIDEITKSLAAELLVNAKIAADTAEAKDKIEKTITSGKALEYFAKMATALGAKPAFCDNFEKYLPKAAIVRPVFAETPGYVKSMDSRQIGMALIGLRGGRTSPEQSIDHATGFSDFCQIGDFVDNEKPLAIIYAQSQSDWLTAQKSLLENIMICPQKTSRPEPIIEKIS